MLGTFEPVLQGVPARTVRLAEVLVGQGLEHLTRLLAGAAEPVVDRLQDLRGSRSLFDLDRQILQNNLFGVDLNDEAIQICRLSLWIKTAERGKALTSLDETVRPGNSVVSDPAAHPAASCQGRRERRMTQSWRGDRAPGSTAAQRPRIGRDW